MWRRGASRGDGTPPSGTSRQGAAGHVVVDEDTEFLQTGGQINLQWKPFKNGIGRNQKGKPGVTSKHLEDNITTDKKVDPAGRTSSSFPGKPASDIIDLDGGNTRKKPVVVFTVPPKLSRAPFDSTGDGTDSSHVIYQSPSVRKAEEQDGPTTAQNISYTNQQARLQGKLPIKSKSGTRTIASKEGGLALGSDGKLYRLKPGLPGRMGPPGQEVSFSQVIMSSRIILHRRSLEKPFLISLGET